MNIFVARFLLISMLLSPVSVNKSLSPLWSVPDTIDIEDLFSFIESYTGSGSTELTTGKKLYVDIQQLYEYPYFTCISTHLNNYGWESYKFICIFSDSPISLMSTGSFSTDKGNRTPIAYYIDSYSKTLDRLTFHWDDHIISDAYHFHISKGTTNVVWNGIGTSAIGGFLHFYSNFGFFQNGLVENVENYSLFPSVSLETLWDDNKLIGYVDGVGADSIIVNGNFSIDGVETVINNLQVENLITSDFDSSFVIDFDKIEPGKNVKLYSLYLKIYSVSYSHMWDFNLTYSPAKIIRFLTGDSDYIPSNPIQNIEYNYYEWLNLNKEFQRHFMGGVQTLTTYPINFDTPPLYQWTFGDDTNKIIYGNELREDISIIFIPSSLNVTDDIYNSYDVIVYDVSDISMKRIYPDYTPENKASWLDNLVKFLKVPGLGVADAPEGVVGEYSESVGVVFTPSYFTKKLYYLLGYTRSDIVDFEIKWVQTDKVVKMALENFGTYIYDIAVDVNSISAKLDNIPDYFSSLFVKLDELLNKFNDMSISTDNSISNVLSFDIESFTEYFTDNSVIQNVGQDISIAKDTVEKVSDYSGRLKDYLIAAYHIVDHFLTSNWFDLDSPMDNPFSGFYPVPENGSGGAVIPTLPAILPGGTTPTPTPNPYRDIFREGF